MLDNPDLGLLYITVPLAITFFLIVVVGLYVINRADAKAQKH